MKLTTVLFFFVSAVIGQNIIRGKIIDINKTPITGSNITLLETNDVTISDKNGGFEFSSVNTSIATLKITHIGYRDYIKRIDVTSSLQRISIILEESNSTLNDVVLISKTVIDKVEETPYAVQSIDVKKLKNTTTDASYILNKTSGIRVRTSGGLGSTYKLSLNGLTDQQIRIFVDEIPIDELGKAYDLNNISVSLTDRIDVFKGVVPVALGADALGGAINIVTTKKDKTFVDVSHSAGSFNTHRSNLNAQYRSDKSGFTLKLNGSLNYSDNDYIMYGVPFFNDKGQEFQINAKRFHDKYRSVFGDIGVGFVKTRWADQLMLHISKAEIDDELQGNLQHPNPLGEVVEEEENNTYRLRYKKSKILGKPIKLDWFTQYNTIRNTVIDTSSNRYTWLGTVFRRTATGQGEFLRDKIHFRNNQKSFLSRVNVSYDLNSNNSVSVNHIYSNIEREDENIVNPERSVAIGAPSSLTKTVTGLEYSSHLLDDKLSVIAAAKRYGFHIRAKEAVVFKNGDFGVEDIEAEQEEWGYLISGAYDIVSGLLLKVSYEKGFRLPNPEEIFGNGLDIIANPQLKPESSRNLNVGLNYKWNFREGYLKTGLNLFQRKVKDYIRYQQGGLQGNYVNEFNTLIRGLELNLGTRIKSISLSGNLTYQEVLDDLKLIKGTQEVNRFYRGQLPNIPVFFTNAELTYQLPPIVKGVSSSVYYGINYVEEFLLFPERAAQKQQDRNNVPEQVLNNLGATFSTHNNRHNLNIEVQNIFNRLAYDNFRQQKPGRAIYVKYRFFLEH